MKYIVQAEFLNGYTGPDYTAPLIGYVTPYYREYTIDNKKYCSPSISNNIKASSKFSTREGAEARAKIVEAQVKESLNAGYLDWTVPCLVKCTVIEYKK